MMWFRWVMLLFGSSAALRAFRAATTTKGQVKTYTVRVGLNLINPAALTGSSIDIAVNGVRHLSRVHPTTAEDLVMLYHIPRGSVVTAHVHESEEACAYWVGTASKHLTVGEWELDFAVSDEGDAPSPAQLFDAYVKVVLGKGKPVTIEVNHAIAQNFSVAEKNQKYTFPGLKKGTLVKVVSASGDTCLYHVGNEEFKCKLDHTWGLLVGADAVIQNEKDEGVIGKENLQNRTVKITLEPTETKRAPWLRIELNGHRLARKARAATGRNTINVHHVEDGSVITAVFPTTGEACGVYVSMNMQNTMICAGWTFNFTITEENRDELNNYELSYTVERVSNTTGSWNLEIDGWKGDSFWGPTLFPDFEGDQRKGTEVVPIVNDTRLTDCTHVVGGNAVTCEHGGWFFTIQSELNMRQHGWNAGHWSWVPSGSDDEDDRIVTATMTASDRTSTKSRFQCFAHEDLEYAYLPLGEKETKIKKEHPMFKEKYLMGSQTKNAKKIKFATYTVAFRLGETPFDADGGFMCTVYDDKGNKMCEAHSLGTYAWTMIPGCTMEIDWQLS